ncbi:hypothetical protein LSH36_559g00023 [Paralvinella palmiformis]|uniref:Sulfotransferase domain-containing protein n=1 Tax=Paralvinella palmiformis TaxID=53620 RepID=A0AAD9J6D9_9ANNE|nr:hypothetical protein LSH36_559g00023 [Paralvinella palmiformis]
MADYRLPGRWSKDGMVFGRNVAKEAIDRLESFEMSEGEVLLATYPKTGTTWLQELIWLVCNSSKMDLARSVPLDRRFPYLELQLEGSQSGIEMYELQKGIIRCRDLADTSEEETLDNLSSQGITEVRKIRVQRDGRRINTGIIILTFGLPVLPTSVKIGFLRVKVDVYISNPLRCFKGQRYGHHRMACKRELTCAKCGTTAHEDKECKQKPHCVNCDGDRGSFSRDCPLWKKEKDIQTIKVTQGISFPEARKVVEQRGSTPTSARSYSDVVGVTKSSVPCQTDMTWPLRALQPSQMPRQKHPVSKAVSTMTVADAAQSEVTPATKTRLQTKRGNTPSPSSVMEPLTSQTVSTKRSSNKTKPTHVGSKPTTPLKQRKRHCLTEKIRPIKTPLSPQTNITSWRIFWMGPPWTTMTWIIQAMMIH